MLFIEKIKLIINVVAAVGKEHIEKTNLPWGAKEALKLTVDMLATYLSEHGACSIPSICIAARKCDVQKVVAIPRYSSDGKCTIFLRAYGGNGARFFTMIGCYILPMEGNEDIFNLIDRAEKENGIEVYHRY